MTMVKWVLKKECSGYPLMFWTRHAALRLYLFSLLRHFPSSIPFLSCLAFYFWISFIIYDVVSSNSTTSELGYICASIDLQECMRNRYQKVQNHHQMPQLGHQKSPGEPKPQVNALLSCIHLIHLCLWLLGFMRQSLQHTIPLFLSVC